MKKLLNKIYKRIPFKQQLFSFIRNIIKVPHRIYRHLYFDGVISFKVFGKKVRMNQKGYDVENTLFWGGIEGCWEKVSVDLWVKLSKRSTTILDVGANTGAYALVAKTVNSNADVYAFEPLDFIYKKLVDNTRLNELDIKCMPFALSDFDGNAKVYAESLDHLYSVTVNNNLSLPEHTTHEIEICARKLSTVVSEQHIAKIDLMKIDVEQHEAEVLRGMGEYLNKWRPDILIEILTDEVGQRVEDLVRNFGYLYFNNAEDGRVKQVNKIGKSDYYNYLLCSADNAKYLQLI